MSKTATEKLDSSTPATAFTAEHGINPGGGVYEERPQIPPFGGVEEVAKLTLMFTLWSKVDDFLYQKVGIKPHAVAKEEKKHRAVLRESESYIVVLLCLLNNEHYSASSLVDALVGADATADQRRNARKRLLDRTIPVLGERYGLLDFSERHVGNSMEYSICRSERLVQFAETYLVPGFNNLVSQESVVDEVTVASDSAVKEK